mmetsp:Transcript_50682/g.94980  ORF Transcript_50682/g.94980 Transcript_50682/m.94980 type:complete len:87 (-) Transcript_50682:40-300(-)
MRLAQAKTSSRPGVQARAKLAITPRVSSSLIVTMIGYLNSESMMMVKTTMLSFEENCVGEDKSYDELNGILEKEAMCSRERTVESH